MTQDVGGTRSRWVRLLVGLAVACGVGATTSGCLNRNLDELPPPSDGGASGGVPPVSVVPAPTGVTIAVADCRVEHRSAASAMLSITWRFTNHDTVARYVLLTHPLNTAPGDPIVLDYMAPADSLLGRSNPRPSFEFTRVPPSDMLTYRSSIPIPAVDSVRTVRLVGRFGCGAAVPNVVWSSSRNWNAAHSWQQPVVTDTITVKL